MRRPFYLRASVFVALRGVSHVFSIGEMHGEEVPGMSLASEKTLSAQRLLSGLSELAFD